MYGPPGGNRRLGGESNREIVSFRVVRAFLRARGLVALWNSMPKLRAYLFPFPLWGAELSLFPFGAPSFPFFPPQNPQNSCPTSVNPPKLRSGAGVGVGMFMVLCFLWFYNCMFVWLYGFMVS